MSVDVDPVALDAASVCSIVLERVVTALADCGNPVVASYVGAGFLAWDDCCGMCVVAPERIFQSAVFPIEGPDVTGCFNGLIAVQLVVLVVRCVPTVDDRGRAPTPAELGEAYGVVLSDAAVVWNVLAGPWPQDWESANLAQTFVGAEGGCVGVETRITVGLDQEAWCPVC